jgi:integrase
MIMATITLSLSSKVDKISNKSEILIRFVGSREHIFRCKSGLYITPERWNDADGKAIIPRLATAEQKSLVNLQTTLDNLKNTIIESYTAVDKTTVDKSWLETVVDKFHHPEKFLVEDKPKAPSFIELFYNFVENRKLSAVRKNNFKVIGRALQRFELYQQAVEDENFVLSLESINLEVLRQFDKFLREEHIYCTKPEYKIIYDTFPEKRTPQARGQNTINDIHTKLRTFYIWANDSVLTTNNPYKNFKIEECVYGSPIYISIEERNQIYNKDLSSRPQLAIQRDIFVFQCLTGCRVGDLKKLKRTHYINGAIEYIPRKTKDGRPVTVRVPLNDTAKEILKRYETFAGDSLLPFISEQKYNDAIKKVFELAEVTRMVTVVNPTTREEEKKPINEIASSHMARRTFIGNLYKKVKDPNLVGSLSGHKEGSKAFARYRDIDEDMKKELVSLLD